ncbi:hypothetical protein [Streptomyces sp. NPDC096105]|uniref:hypothetical protein n=1 Tax=Streptomyces sp. NPDC096105 TaxID=3366074 RepID=UPI00382432D6
MRRIPLARPGPVMFAVTAALTLGALPATAAVSASPDGPVPPLRRPAARQRPHPHRHPHHR